ncbi:oxidoreductase of aldo/keto reductase family, subgroup 1 [Rhodococcus wratislaviensis]|uniref:Oxidoreductase of aldo/keto reductase family, subgroup 1 n=1 Tax=Rhodococcus wratislaviensis TaxID=44752 RepID=A0A402C8Y5_RHOWR|nr:aldo/keto reductase [Rhodococcus wratislaviensis]GCE40082.1 oxidoreductase of aldo/keto reductase family, subgroup 1 [Rhodococcus wratislaviensis]
MTEATTIPSVTLSNGVVMPAIGFGVFQIPDDAMDATVRHALAAGYRAFDTAPMYGNERSLGRALTDSGVPREELFVTTKVSNEDQGYQSTLDAVEKSVARLGLDYVDLCLIHWPAPARGTYLDTWRALEQLHAAGLVRAIGVSNFQADHLDRLLEVAAVRPMVNQIEIHPLLPQQSMVELHRSLGIHTQAWAPLARGRLQENPVLTELARRHDVSLAQLVLRWHLQRGTVPLPKSSSPERMRANIDVFDFALDADEVAQISALDRNERTGPHPDDVN